MSHPDPRTEFDPVQRTNEAVVFGPKAFRKRTASLFVLFEHHRTPSPDPSQIRAA